MPSFTQVVASLAGTGPIVEVVVGASVLFAQVMARKGLPIPTPVKALAMIDTGAAASVIDPSIVQALGLHPVGIGQLTTPVATVPLTVPQFNISLGFPGGTMVQSAIAIEVPLPNQPIQVLVGRDVLAHAVLTYIGYLNQFTLSF